MKTKRLSAFLFLACFVAACVRAEEGQQLAEKQCSSCHALKAVEYSQLEPAERATRKAPPLFYAGNKFRRDWMLAWLQSPTRIRPAGYYPPDHVQPGDKHDEIIEKSLPVHMKLAKEDAIKVSDYLMTLVPYTAKLDTVQYRPGSISWKLGNLNFGKFNGCDSCHRDAPDYGGVSGPELYTVWKRLQPKFIASFISDPVFWDAHALMPHKNLNPAVVKKLTDYLKVNGEDQK